MKSQGAVYFPGGKGRVSPVDEQDVASVACAILTQPGYEGQIFELTGPEVLSISGMVQILAQVLGKPIRYVEIPMLLGALWMLRFGLPLYVVWGLVETFGALRRNEYAYVSDAVERIGGCSARTFEAWAQDHLTAFQ